ncbi:PRC-barrel domain-containing protein [Pararobbsia silviterrae]|uniref:PRC-barrel domain containing protein n=1 Tax=Pararobbsia silviterrae TaxID=1792498 RepID=A0A494XSF8_9BURK|nr:PRC-barrel domain-containing protein [Pararobbsia silviterrae]RKP51806.1 PRC-barrel domain containing protein [Pararobbsia silviterrae]
MKTKALITSAAIAIGCVTTAGMAQVAGLQPIGVTAEQSNGLLKGWSVRKALVDEPVYNDMNNQIGSIYDIIIAPDRKATYAILSVGGFLGMGKHYVAVDIDKFSIRDGNLFLAGASKDALKAAPEFEYNKLEKATKPEKVSVQ